MQPRKGPQAARSLPFAEWRETYLRHTGSQADVDWRRLAGELPRLPESHREQETPGTDRPTGERGLSAILLSMEPGALVTASVYLRDGIA